LEKIAVTAQYCNELSIVLFVGAMNYQLSVNKSVKWIDRCLALNSETPWPMELLASGDERKKAKDAKDGIGIL
jgi:hypothetical protein